jgi:hypothetical protein
VKRRRFVHEIVKIKKEQRNYSGNSILYPTNLNTENTTKKAGVGTI